MAIARLRYLMLLYNYKHIYIYIYISPLSPLNNYHSSSTNISTTTFPPPFPPFPSLSFPPLQSPFPSPLTNLNLPHLIKSSPFLNLPPQPHPLTFFPSQY